MKKTSLCLLFVMAGCSSGLPPTAPTVQTVTSPAAPTPTPRAELEPMTVAVRSDATGQTVAVTIAADDPKRLEAGDPQPPSCAWRDLVVGRHIALGGAKNDIVTLANLHRVYIVDNGSPQGYALFDYPQAWCTR